MHIEYKTELVYEPANKSLDYEWTNSLDISHMLKQLTAMTLETLFTFLSPIAFFRRQKKYYISVARSKNT